MPILIRRSLLSLFARNDVTNMRGEHGRFSLAELIGGAALVYVTLVGLVALLSRDFGIGMTVIAAALTFSALFVGQVLADHRSET